MRQAQVRCDTIQAEFRAEQSAASARPSIRRDAPPLDPALVQTDDVLRQRLAEELDYARRLLDNMGDDLTSDNHVVMRHSVALQSIDIIGQMLGHIAAVTRSSAPERAADRIGMSELRARLTRNQL